MIGYEAHKTISSAHGYPCEQPSEEFGIELIRILLDNPNSWGVLAERQPNLSFNSIYSQVLTQQTISDFDTSSIIISEKVFLIQMCSTPDYKHYLR